MTAGLQVNLSVGTNIVKVKVTAPDTTTTETYTVNVFRAAVPVACSAASMTNRIWTGNLTVGSPAPTSSASTGYATDSGSPPTTAASPTTDFDLAGTTLHIEASASASSRLVPSTTAATHKTPPSVTEPRTSPSTSAPTSSPSPTPRLSQTTYFLLEQPRPHLGRRRLIVCLALTVNGPEPSRRSR